MTSIIFWRFRSPFFQYLLISMPQIEHPILSAIKRGFFTTKNVVVLRIFNGFLPPSTSNFDTIRLITQHVKFKLIIFVFFLQDSHCEWLIKAKNDSQFITLTFHSMGTECSYDYIFVYDGDSFKSPLLGSFSGRTDPQKVVATSGSVCFQCHALNVPQTSIYVCICF